MPHFVLRIHGDHSLILEFQSEVSVDSPHHSHMLTDAIVEIIERADLGLWMKHEDTELQPDDFHAAILRAVAASYRCDLPYDNDHLTDEDLVREILNTMERTGG